MEMAGCYVECKLLSIQIWWAAHLLSDFEYSGGEPLWSSRVRGFRILDSFFPLADSDPSFHRAWRVLHGENPASRKL
jgi:hypothetical protein